ncbi:MAG TPA: D-alanyl-D-alanine carboxypeptidase family protein [Lachnospiraceae bacterium]|nr:D-alanyl-D-alanine carboxypeptidase family protein [Lachnospiraceae bacterium]
MNRKKIIIAASAMLLVVVVYSSIVSLSKARNKSNDYEYYYTDESIAEADNIVSDYKAFSLTHDTDGNSVLLGSVSLDTDPESITVFVNKEYSLPADYVPSDLTVPNVPFNFDYTDEKKMLRKEAAFALEDLIQAASDDGLSIYGVSGYRSYKRQEQIYNKNIATKGALYTNRYSAKPGFSEHQTGLSIDVSAKSVAFRLDESFASTPEGKWLENHAYEYGFIIRYPKDKSDITGYSYEPWHIRYVGKELAEYLYTNKLTLEEFYNYTPSISFIEEDYAHDSAVDDAAISENETAVDIENDAEVEDTTKDQEKDPSTTKEDTKTETKDQASEKDTSKEDTKTDNTTSKDTDATTSKPGKDTTTSNAKPSKDDTTKDETDPSTSDNADDTESDDTTSPDTDNNDTDTQNNASDEDNTSTDGNTSTDQAPGSSPNTSDPNVTTDPSSSGTTTSTNTTSSGTTTNTSTNGTK